MVVQHAVEREVMTTFVSGLKLDNLARTVGRQVQVYTGVVVVVHTEITIEKLGEIEDGGNGVEQANKVDTDVHRGIEIRHKGSAAGLKQFLKQTTVWL
ncbi:hypothetical protein D9M70_636930 [compost metagenome]